MSGIGFERHPLYYKIVGYAIYATAGILLVINARCTAIAYRDGDVPLLVGWIFALAFTAVSIGTGLFLTSPDTWGGLWFSFVTAAAAAGRQGDRRAPIWITALLLSLLLVFILAFWAVVNVMDWQTTWIYFQGLGVQGVYLVSSVVLLIIGPEFACILAHAVLKLGKQASITHLEESSNLDPQRVYLKEVYKGRVAMAREAGQQDATQRQH